MNARAKSIQRLRTEKRNPSSTRLDTMTTIEIAALMNRQDARTAAAVRKSLPQIAAAIDLIVGRLSIGGRLIYVGSGTSGRIGALDAAECPPTFGTNPKLVQYVIAGGAKALGTAGEADEDSGAQGRKDLAAKKPGKRDVVVGIAASGRTPYTIAAVEFARKKGAVTVAVVCNGGSALAKAANLAIVADVGPEVLAGSTRLKAGTAQKMICNMLTTGTMARLGYVYGNLMVNVHLRNEKLLERGLSILHSATGVSRERAIRALGASGMSVPVALLMVQTGISKAGAVAQLRKAKGNIRLAIEVASHIPKSESRHLRGGYTAVRRT